MNSGEVCYNMETMDSFNVNEYSEKSREVLRRVVEEIREQFLDNNKSRQFWFNLSQVSDELLSEPIIRKWLNVLSRKGILHYYEPNYSEVEKAIAFSQNYLEENYNWEPTIISSYILELSSRIAPCIALDVYDTDFDKHLKLIQMNTVWDRFQRDRLGNYFYDGNELTEINRSPTYKIVLGEFLKTDAHTLSVDEVTRLVVSDDDDDYDSNARRNRVISALNKGLRSVSHNVEIKTHKSGHSADYYTLVVVE